MHYFPICLDLSGKHCTVIGGGRVAARKAASLLACGARVTVVSPELHQDLRSAVEEQTIHWKQAAYQTGDLADAFLVIAATDRPEVQEAVQREAEQRNIPINVADVPERCNFILPATMRRGDLTISISTGGNSPALARAIRQQLETTYGPEYGIMTAILGLLRPVILNDRANTARHKEIFAQLADMRMIHWIQEQQWYTIKDHILAVVGNHVPTAIMTKIHTLIQAACPVEK